MHLYFAALAALNLLSLVSYAADKLCARAGWRRVPERTLLLLSLAGGAAGGLVAMLLCRHKIRKPYFVMTQIVGIIAHGGIVLWGLSSYTM